MRPYYINKGKYGYYRIRLIDPETGIITCDRSSHTTDIKAAESIAVKWMLHGVPSRPVAKAKKPHADQTAPETKSQSDMELLLSLAKKLGVTIQTPAQPDPIPAPVAATQEQDVKLTAPYGIIAGPPVCDFLLDFRDEETSEYIERIHQETQGKRKKPAHPPLPRHAAGRYPLLEALLPGHENRRA